MPGEAKTPKTPKKSKAEIELDKMLAEARAAEAEILLKEASMPQAETAVKEPEQPKQEPQQTGEKKNYLLWFFAGIMIVFAVGGFFLYTSLHHNSNLTPPTTGLATYNPEHLLTDWELTSYGTNLAGIDPDLRTEMMSQGVVDAAVWEFSKNNEKLYFWTRIYADNKTRDAQRATFTNPFVWYMGTETKLAFGTDGIVGVYKSAEDLPLMAYVADGPQIWYVSYYNSKDSSGAVYYNATNITTDKTFLASTMRAFYSSFNKTA